MTESVLLATRYSDHKQDGGTSTEIQVDACSQYCDRQNSRNNRTDFNSGTSSTFCD